MKPIDRLFHLAQDRTFLLFPLHTCMYRLPSTNPQSEPLLDCQYFKGDRQTAGLVASLRSPLGRPWAGHRASGGVWENCRMGLVRIPSPRLPSILFSSPLPHVHYDDSQKVWLVFCPLMSVRSTCYFTSVRLAAVTPVLRSCTPPNPYLRRVKVSDPLCSQDVCRITLQKLSARAVCGLGL